MKFRLFVPPGNVFYPTMCDIKKGLREPDQTVGVEGRDGKITNPQIELHLNKAKTDKDGKHYFDIDEATAWKIAGHLPPECTLKAI